MITPLDAMNVLRYLAGAQAITLTEDQDAVWADYINAEVPDARPMDLAPAARLAIKEWSRQGRAWRIDVDRFAQAVRKVRADRMPADVDIPRLLGDDITGAQSIAFDRHVRRLLADGESIAAAEAAAYAAVGRTKPLEITTNEPLDIRALIAATERKSA